MKFGYKKIFGILFAAALTMCAGLALAGCGDDGGENPPPGPPAGQTNVDKVNSMILALPQDDAFTASDIPALEAVVNAYSGLTDYEKGKVNYSKVTALFSVPVYLDETTKEYIPESAEAFEFNPYLGGKTVTSVTLNGERLLSGQYTVKGNAVTIGENYLKSIIPSVAEVVISTDVSAEYSYRVFAGMLPEETLFINADNKKTEGTALSVITDDKFTFAVQKNEGFVYAVNFSYTDNSVKYDFEEGRKYNLYFDFSVPSECEGVTLPIYFEGPGGTFCSIDFPYGEPIISSVAEEKDKTVTVSYMGGGVYRFYASFTAESDRLSLVIGLEGAATSVKMDNICLYPVCGAPVFKEREYFFDTSGEIVLNIPVTVNGGKITGVSVDGKSAEYGFENGVLSLSDGCLLQLKKDEEHVIEIVNRFGKADASLFVYDGLPVVKGESVKRYASGDGEISFEFDFKGKTFKELRLNGATVNKSSYKLEGETLTFTVSYLDTLYSDNMFEATFTDSAAKTGFTVKTNYIYKSNFRKGVSDADLNFAPDGTGSVVYEDGKFWANYKNPVSGTVLTLNANTFSFEEEKTYEISYNLKFGPGHSASWWSPVWLKGCHDIIYIKTAGAGVLTKDNVYAAGNPLDTLYSYEKDGQIYRVSIVFTARGRGLSKPDAIEYGSWDGAADLYMSDFAIAEYSEKKDALFIGSDLLTEGYWGGYAADTALYETVNKSKIGSDINYWIDAVGEIAAELSPRKIILSVGDNDLYSGKTADTVIADFKNLTDKVKRVFPSSRLFVLSMIKTVKYADKNADVTAINGALAEYAAQGGYKFVDITVNLESESGAPSPELYLRDGIHIARGHYSKISSEILKGCSLDGSLDALFIGDSYMSKGYWHSYEEDMEDINSLNLGVGGTSTGYWKERVASLAENYTAAAVVVHIGVNDIDDQGADSATTIVRIKSLLNDLHAAFPAAEIWWMTISPNGMFAHLNHMYPPVNEAIKAFAEENDWLGVIDAAQYFTGEDGKFLPQYYLSEEMHLNATGYEVFVREIRKALGL